MGREYVNSIEQGVEVFYKDENVWCTQKAMAMLFDCSTDNVGLHLKNIFASGELEKDTVTEKISATASDGKTTWRSSTASMPSLLLATV